MADAMDTSESSSLRRSSRLASKPTKKYTDAALRAPYGSKKKKQLEAIAMAIDQTSVEQLPVELETLNTDNDTELDAFCAKFGLCGMGGRKRKRRGMKTLKKKVPKKPYKKTHKKRI